MPYPTKLHAEQIVQTAKQLLEEGGPDSLTMRSLAAALGVRASSLYRHFEHRERLMLALGAQAATELQQELEQINADLGPREALKQLAELYLQYARNHPHLYDLLMTKDTKRTPEQLATSSEKKLWNTMLHFVGRLSGHPDDTDHAVAYWTFLHGFCVLERSEMFGASGPKGGLEVGLNALLDHMQRSHVAAIQDGI